MNVKMTNPVWLMTMFFIIISGLIVVGRGKGAIILTGIVILAIIVRKYWPGGASEAFTDISEWLARKEFGMETENEKAAYFELIGIIPSVGEIESRRIELFIRLGKYFTNPTINNMTAGFVIGMLDRLDHYFRLLYANMHSVIFDPDYPQRNMVYALDTQRHILQTLHNFVFIDGKSSDMPNWLAKSRHELSLTFNTVNNGIANFVNTRNSRAEIINRHSGFIAHPGEPLPNGTFRDSYDLY